MRSLCFSALLLGTTSIMTPGFAGTVCPTGTTLSACDNGSFAAAPGDLIIDGTAYRSYDGSGNNVTNESWGAAGAEFTSRAQSDTMTRLDGPDARSVSTGLGEGVSDAPTSSAGLSSMFWAWGQFLDHDITLTPESHDTGDLALGGDLNAVNRSLQTSTGTQLSLIHI